MESSASTAWNTDRPQRPSTVPPNRNHGWVMVSPGQKTTGARTKSAGPLPDLVQKTTAVANPRRPNPSGDKPPPPIIIIQTKYVRRMQLPGLKTPRVSRRFRKQFKLSPKSTKVVAAAARRDKALSLYAKHGKLVQPVAHRCFALRQMAKNNDGKLEDGKLEDGKFEVGTHKVFERSRRTFARRPRGNTSGSSDLPPIDL